MVGESWLWIKLTFKLVPWFVFTAVVQTNDGELQGGVHRWLLCVPPHSLDSSHHSSEL